mgnify:CR=1 FL=1
MSYSILFGLTYGTDDLLGYMSAEEEKLVPSNFEEFVDDFGRDEEIDICLKWCG